MALITAYGLSFYKIEVDNSKSLLSSVWQRPVTTEELIAGGTRLYDVLRDTQAERVIADARLLGTLSPEAKEWMSSKFYGLLSQTNLKKIARVLPQNLFPRLALESVVTRAEALGMTKFEVKNFTDPQEALEWLLK